MNGQLLSSTGDIKWGCKFHGKINNVTLGVTRKDTPNTYDFDASECCEHCKGVMIETKAWFKKDGFKRCSCFTYDDNFDIVSLERRHATTTIGYCNEMYNNLLT